MKTPTLILTSALITSIASANIVVNGDFSSPMAGTYSASVFGGGNLNGTGVAAGSANIYDGGWVTYSASSNDYWEVSGGEGVRTFNANFNYGGFGQFVSNPGDGNFDNGDSIEFSLDYIFNGLDTTGGFAATVYGVTAPNGTSAGWNLFSGEGISNAGQSGSVTIDTDYTSGADYQFYVLDTVFSSSASTGTISYASGAIELTRDYALFAIVFQADRDSGSAGPISVDNVSLAAIPEPGHYAMLLGVVTLGLLRVRRR
ncbi:PEP-CTERM sorting domain-containing protein [Cerasicoccus fimbriatus]|uniref:PEP-CTERM sorting domain-containing protein n=1 Tax=Cerasicoccus fimbriatus TaxID=3014554 RepID=UPI0022B37658|nr:PEP-CTERM sorting domain-containing protein [Cerasicoccus sp. TK19100]